MTRDLPQRYSDNWRRNRKLFQQNFRQATIDRFHPIQYDKVHEFLRELIDTPDDFMRHTMAYEFILPIEPLTYFFLIGSLRE